MPLKITKVAFIESEQQLAEQVRQSRKNALALKHQIEELQELLIACEITGKFAGKALDREIKKRNPEFFEKISKQYALEIPEDKNSNQGALVHGELGETFEASEVLAFIRAYAQDTSKSAEIVADLGEIEGLHKLH